LVWKFAFESWWGQETLFDGRYFWCRLKLICNSETGGHVSAVQFCFSDSGVPVEGLTYSVRYPRFFQFASVAVLFSLFGGRSVPAPAQPVTRFRAVEAYGLFITVTSDDDMKVDGAGESMQRKYKEKFVTQIHLKERHLDNDYVQWIGEGISEQTLEETRKEVHFAGNFVEEIKSADQGPAKT